MPAEVAGCLGKRAVVKVVMLSRQPVVLDKAVAKGRPIVVSKVAELLENVRAKIVPVGSPKAKVRGDPCRGARWLPRVVKHVERRRNVAPSRAVAKDGWGVATG